MNWLGEFDVIKFWAWGEVRRGNKERGIKETLWAELGIKDVRDAFQVNKFVSSN